MKNIMQSVLQSYKNFGSVEEEKLCKRFFPKEVNKNLEGSIATMAALFDMKRHEIRREDFEEWPFDIEDYNDVIFDPKNNSINKTLLTDALKILRCNKLVVMKKRKYDINLPIFYKDVRYRLKEHKILSDMTRLMISYIRSDVRLTADNFFRELDKLFAFVLQPSKYYNSTYDFEQQIYTAIANEDYIDVIIDGKTESIKPIGIDMNGSIKKLTYQNDKHDEDQEVPINSISSPVASYFNALKAPAPSKSSVMQQTQYLATSALDIEEPVIEKIEVILAVNTQLYEYFFNIDVFERMDIITDKHAAVGLANEFGMPLDKLYFSADSNKVSANYFLVKGYDTVDNVVQVVQQNLQYIKVLTPQLVVDQVKKNMELYFKNENL